MRSPVACITIVVEICALLIIVRQIPFAQSNTLHRVPHQFKTIQSAIDKSRTGDTVLIDHGWYSENIRITKNIVVASRFILDRDETHIHSTIIDGSKGRDSLHASTITVAGATDTTCVIAGLTIRGGKGSYVFFKDDKLSEHWILGGGILIIHTGARIAHNIVTQNFVRAVGAIQTTCGAAIATVDLPERPNKPPFIIIEHNTAVGNIATGQWVEVSGIAVNQPGVVRHNTIVHNRTIAKRRAPGGGLGLYFGKRYDIIVDGNYIRHNSAGIGGGILVGTIAAGLGDAMIINNIIADNFAFEVGGGVHVAENASAILINNTVVGNRAPANGDGLNTAGGAFAVLVNNIFWKNTPRAISSWSSVRAVNNLIEGDFPGINTFNEDPLFISGDSLFRLSSQSPAIGVGKSGIYLADELVTVPSSDIVDGMRPLPFSSAPDLGANESPFIENENTRKVLNQWKDESEYHRSLTLYLRQTTDPVYSGDSSHILRAGLMTGSVMENDSINHGIADSSRQLTLTLPPGENSLAVELIARGRSKAKRLYGILRLEGIDPVFGALPRNRNSIYRHYRRLHPGMYSLVFYGGDELGVIDAVNHKVIRIVVLPYWYQRWWATVLLIVSVAGGLFGLYSLKVSRYRREQMLLREFSRKQIELQEAERKRIASELHDGIGQDLLLVNNELQCFMSNGDYTKTDLRRVANLVHESIDEVREISSNLHPHHLERLGFCAAVESMVDRISHSTKIRIRYQCDPIDGLMLPDAQIHLYRIIQEALSNVVKHSGATETSLSIVNNKGILEIVVQDNGKGLDTLTINGSNSLNDDSIDRMHGFGMKTMSERGRIIGGTMSVSSTPGRGTAIRLTLPVTGT